MKDEGGDTSKVRGLGWIGRDEACQDSLHGLPCLAMRIVLGIACASSARPLIDGEVGHQPRVTYEQASSV